MSILFFFTLTGVSPASEPADRAGGKITRGLFTTEVIDREPVDQVLILPNDTKTVYFFTELRHFEGQKITHRWEYEGNLVLEKQFEVVGPRWRIYSKKVLNPRMTGEWTVTVLNERGWPIYVDKFRYADKSKEDSRVILPLERE